MVCCDDVLAQLRESAYTHDLSVKQKAVDSLCAWLCNVSILPNGQWIETIAYNGNSSNNAGIGLLEQKYTSVSTLNTTENAECNYDSPNNAVELLSNPLPVRCSEKNCYMSATYLLELLEKQQRDVKLQLGQLRFWIPYNRLNNISLDSQVAFSLPTNMLEENIVEIDISFIGFASYSNRPLLVQFLVCECQGNPNDIAIVTLRPKVQTSTVSKRFPCIISGGWTPLMLSCRNDYIAVMSILLQRNASVTIRDNEGYTALAHAAFGNSVASVLLLTYYGAPIDNINGLSKTLEDFALETNHVDLYRLAVYLKPLLTNTIKNQLSSPTHTSFKSNTMYNSSIESFQNKNHSPYLKYILPIIQVINMSIGGIDYAKKKTLPSLHFSNSWLEILLPKLSFLNFLIVTISIELELSLMEIQSHYLLLLQNMLCLMLLPLAWSILLYFLFSPQQIPFEYDYGHTDVELVQNRLNSSTVLTLGLRERPWTSSSNEDDISLEKKRFYQKRATVLNSIDISRLCYVCFKIQPYRAYHCKYCQTCIQCYDHHCFWLRCCIGNTNHRLFIMFILCCACLQDLHLILIIYSLTKYFNCLSLNIQQRYYCIVGQFLLDHIQSRSFFYVSHLFIFTILCGIMHAVSVCWIHLLLFSQLMNVAKNVTSYEKFKGYIFPHFWHEKFSLGPNGTLQKFKVWRNPFTKGWWGNCAEFWTHATRNNEINFDKLKQKDLQLFRQEVRQKLRTKAGI